MMGSKVGIAAATALHHRSFHGSLCTPLPSTCMMQDRREWIDKPDGALITAEAAKASTRNLFKAPTSGVDYYEVLQVGVGVALQAWLNV